VNLRDWNDPPRTAMDLAAATKNHEVFDMLRRHQGRGLCKAGPQGGLVRR